MHAPCGKLDSLMNHDQLDSLLNSGVHVNRFQTHTTMYELYCVIYGAEPIALMLDNLARQCHRRI